LDIAKWRLKFASIASCLETGRPTAEVASDGCQRLMPVKQRVRLACKTGNVELPLHAVKILIAADGSAFTQRTLAHLAAHGEWLAPSHGYTVVHAITPLPPRAAAYFDRDSLAAYYLGESETVFKPIRSFFKQHGVEATFVSQVGPVAKVIAALADKDRFDLLVMGSHGHGRLGALVMGSVATKVLASCRTPALIVR
jgi:nucleotide-binding universal stress UspA family protein